VAIFNIFEFLEIDPWEKGSLVTQIGILSDTHGYWQPEIVQLFAGVEMILHAGDIGSSEIIEKLENIAPLKAVRGNSDFYPLSVMYPFQEIVAVGNFEIFLTHQFNEYKASDRQRILALGSIRLVVCGHTHAYSLRQLDRISILNPGSAGRSGRLDAPGVVLLTVTDDDFRCERRLFP
jgi:putative phosphoesterase